MMQRIGMIKVRGLESKVEWNWDTSAIVEWWWLGVARREELVAIVVAWCHPLEVKDVKTWMLLCQYSWYRFSD